jgi:hypothetical protein
MTLKGLAIFVLVLAALLAQMANGQTTANHPAASSAKPSAPAKPATPAPTSAATQATPSAPSSATAQPAQTISVPLPRTDCEGGTCDYQPPKITVTNPPPKAIVPAVWPLQDRITWVANILLVLLGYVGIMMGLSLLRKIERQTRYVEAAAEAAANLAQTTLLNVQSIIRAERPWILITVEPSRAAENAFNVIATNRGRSPAKIVATVDQTTIAVDQASLPAAPEYNQAVDPLLTPIFLLPDESTSIKAFSREDVKGVCGSDEIFEQVESWRQKIFVYGNVTYMSLVGPEDDPPHETSWCCWYIHGKQKSGMVMAGPAAYNKHA